MPNYIQKLLIKTGVKERNKFSLDGDTITTSDFFRIQPVKMIHTVPGGKYSIKANTFCRLSAMTNPMYGRCRIINRAFFVPNRIIMQPWNEFITDSPWQDGSNLPTIPSIVTTFTGADVVTLFKDTAYSSTAGTAGTADWTDYTTPNTPVYKVFTALGRRAYTIFRSLGYSFDLADLSAGSYNVCYNALPLLAFFKVMKDWYMNQAYDVSEYNEMFLGVNKQLGYQDLDQVFTRCSLAMYDKDYFTAAQDHPVVPNTGVSSAYSIFDQTADQSVTNGTASGVQSLSSPGSGTPSTPVINGVNTSGVIGSTANIHNISQFLIDQLKALTDFLHRNQIVGSKVADRMLARFGVKPDDAALRQSVPFGVQEIPVQISDVMCTATGQQTQNQSTYSLVGDYAGKGIAYGQGGFNYETNEYGIILVISTIIPKVGYVQGSDRFNTSYLNRLDFFTPEFDGKSGCQAIRRDELKSDYCVTRSSAGANLAPDAIFGFIPRWADMKVGKDCLSGDFVLDSRNTGLAAWHTFRMFAGNVSSTDLTHNEGFTRGSQAQYDRIFAYTGSQFDHFILIYNFNITANLPMSKLFDSYEFDGGREIPMEVNGTQLQ